MRVQEGEMAVQVRRKRWSDERLATTALIAVLVVLLAVYVQMPPDVQVQMAEGFFKGVQN